MDDPREAHMDATYRILKDLKSTRGKGMLFEPHIHPDVEGYTHSDWVGSLDYRRSTCGYVFLLEGIW